MKRELPIIGCALIYLIVAVIPTALSAETVSKPTVTLPANWHLEEETPYPQAPAEYDPQGAGMLMYQDEVDYDFVMVYYEKAPAYTLTEADLEIKAIELFLIVHNYTPYDTGTMTVAKTQAGYAKGYDYDYDTYALELAFVKGNEFLNVYAFYDATSADEAEVMSLINSISVEEAKGISLLLIAIPIGIAIPVIVVVVIILLKRRRKRAEPVPPQEVPESPAPGRFCMGCGTRLTAKGVTCKKCGASPTDFGGPETKTCHCEAVIPATAKFCGECGARQAPTEG